VRWKVGSTSWTTFSHKELAHSTLLCWRNRISLWETCTVGKHQALLSLSQVCHGDGKFGQFPVLHVALSPTCVQERPAP
jgi:hypothetical protein